MDMSSYLVIGIIVACNVVGYVLKNASFCEKIKSNDIPVILIFVGGLLGFINGFVTNDISLNNVIIGCVSGLASVGTYESFVRSLTSIKEEKEEE